MTSIRIPPLAVLALFAAGCTTGPGYSPDQVASIVASTLAALGGSSATAGAAPTAEAHTLPTEAPTPAPATLFVAFTNRGDLAYVAAGGPSVTLTSAGAVEQVRLSDDGQKIAYSRRPAIDQPVELRVVNSDGSADTLLMAPADFDALFPLAGALHHDLFEFAFVPGTHTLLLNTRSIFEGPGLAKHDDLIRIDSDTLARTMLLAPGSGGDFTVSPDGRYLALVRPDTIEIRLIDGSPSGSGVIPYEPVITYSEYAYYAQPVWNPESTMIGVAIPSPDPLAPSTTGSIWRLPLGGSASLVSTIPGQFFLFGTGFAPLVSPDLSHVAFTRPTTAPNIWNLFVASLDGGAENLIASADVAWAGWSPDGLHFVFGLAGPMNLQLGDLSGASAPLITGTDLRWFSPAEFLYLSGSAGAWTLQRGRIGAAGTSLATPAGTFVDYAFAYD